MPHSRTKVLKVKRLKTFWEKSVGLIGKKKITPIYFETRFGIHTFGMLSPIDVVILDKGGKVVKLAENLAPFRVFLWSPRYYRVLELPGGFAVREKIFVGDKLGFTVK